MGQHILVERIPHHALIENWFSSKDFFSILIYLISLLTIYKKQLDHVINSIKKYFM